MKSANNCAFELDKSKFIPSTNLENKYLYVAIIRNMLYL
jgi:hypothetical protein